MSKLRVILLVVLIATLVVSCSGELRFPKWRLPRRGPVDVFIDLIDQVKGIGQGVARQFGGMGGVRR